MSSDNRSALYSSATDNWPTPQDFYDRLNTEFNFELDVCSSRANHKAPFYFALDHEDAARRDGLEADWSDGGATGTVWMNPPYGRTIRAWMAKAFETAHTTGRTVVCLVPVRSSSLWWHDLVLDTGAEVRYVKGRLTFGDATNTAAFGSAVVIVRPSDVIGAPGAVSTMVNKVKTPKGSPVPECEELTTAVVPDGRGESRADGARTGEGTQRTETSPVRGSVAQPDAAAPATAGGVTPLNANDSGGHVTRLLGSRPDLGGATPGAERARPSIRRSSVARGGREWQHVTTRHQSQS